jgi:hypothetical protein
MDTEELNAYGRRLTELTDEMLDKHLIAHFPTVMRRLRGGYCRVIGTKQIVYGWEMLQRYYERGFRDYPTYHWRLWGDADLSGFASLWAVMIHEVAHALQGPITRGDLHTREWQELVLQLKREHPLEAFVERG